MISAIRDSLDAFFGRGRHSVSIPVMDGALQPNQDLEEAGVLLRAPALDNLVALEDSALFSSAERLMRIRAGDPVPVELWRAPVGISCLAAGPDGALAVGLDGKGIVLRGGRHDGREIAALPSGPLVCPTAALFFDVDTLIVASGSSEFKAAEWKRDLMSRGASGSVWRADLATGKVKIVADALEFPYGVARAPGDDILVCEAWRRRILRFGARPGAQTALDGLPGYPARLVSATGGGYWLCLFAPCNQLIEFVLKERNYCRKMMADVPPDYWIAPALASGLSFQEPMQGGAVKQMGILKPWAPVRSYGLLVRLDGDLRPVRSWHSRADGARHGVTSVCEFGGAAIVGVKGGGLALTLGPVGEAS